MKFCENLQKLRKSKNISQEGLAEMLGVTRQSVSKWESGASYPEMEKLMEICKIFHCSLDTLVNKDALLEQEQKENNLLPSILSSLELAVKKTIAILENMSAKEIIKFLVTLFVIAMIILVCKAPFVLLEDSINSIFYHNGGNAFSSFLASLWSFLLNLAYGILAIITFLYIYKVKYLDRIDLVKNEEKIELEKEEIVIKKEPKSSKTPKYVYEERSGFFDFLTTLIIYFVKFICGIVLIWDLCALVTATILFVFLIILMTKGLVLIGPFLIGIGVIAFTILIAILLINFIANRKSNSYATLITLFSSMIVGCIGVALSCWYFTRLTYIEGSPRGIEKKEISKTFAMTEELVIEDHYNVVYQEDESLKDQVKIDVEYYYDNYKPEIELISNNYIATHIERKESKIYPKEIIDQIIKDLKEKKFYTYDNLYTTKILVTTTKENIRKIKTNTFDKYYVEEDREEYQKELEEYLND